MEQTINKNTGSREPLIRIRDVVFRRGRRTILDGVSMDIHRGSIVAFMGPSGVGKTTILRLISGQLRPDEGSIEVDGQLMDTMLAHSMKEPEMRHGLDYLSKLYLGYTPIPTSDLIASCRSRCSSTCATMPH